MTFTGDHRDQLGDRRDRVPIDDAAAETLLCGGETISDLEPVAGFIRTLRESARRRVVPSARLAARMASGWPPGPGAPPVRAYAGTGRHRLTRHGGTRGVATSRLMAWAGAAGLVMAIIGTATAGFARALPEPAQQRFEAVVEVVTGHEFPERPDRDGSGLAPERTPADDERPNNAGDRPGGAGGPGATDRGPGGSAGPGPATGDGPDAGGPAGAQADPDGLPGSEPAGEASGEAAGSPGASPTGLGGEVREGARDGSVDGGEVSGRARGHLRGAEERSNDDGSIDGGSIDGGDTDGSTDGNTDDGGSDEVVAAGRVEPNGVKPYGLAGAGSVPISRTPGERLSGPEPPTAPAGEQPRQDALGARGAGGVVTGEPVSGAGAGA